MISIIDYGFGNVRSLQNSLSYLGYDSVVTSDKEVISKSEKLFLPGVGAFGDAMNSLRKCDLIDLLNNEVLVKGKPIFGICLGMQLMAKSSLEHGNHDGLGWIDSEIIRIPNSTNLKIPHVGWNEIVIEESDPVFFGLPKNSLDFYFVHSFYMKCNVRNDISSTVKYGAELTSSIRKENIVATQFHPEKSQDNGLKLLENWLSEKC